MNFVVEVIPAAVADIEAIHESLNAYSERAADQTCALIKAAIRGLSDFPRRYAVARESTGFSIEIRQLVVGNYCVSYQMIGVRVMVMRIVHASQATLRPMDLM